jgi:hypothetical protein
MSMPLLPDQFPGQRPNKDNFWRGLFIGAAVVLIDYWLRYQAYKDAVRPYGTVHGFRIFEGQYRQIKLRNPRLSPSAAKRCAVVGAIAVLLVVIIRVQPWQGTAAWVALGMIVAVWICTRHHKPTQAQLEPVWAWHKANRQGNPPDIPAWSKPSTAGRQPFIRFTRDPEGPDGGLRR